LRHQHDPVYRWLRDTLEAVVPDALKRVGPGTAPGFADVTK